MSSTTPTKCLTNFSNFITTRCFNNKIEIPTEDYDVDDVDNGEVSKVKKTKNNCLYFVLTVEKKLYKFEDSLDEVLERLPGAFFLTQEF